MSYHQFKPHNDLVNYIDAFWIVEGVEQQTIKTNILPDGCVDLIFNLGDDCKTDEGILTMQSGKPYLVGTMTTAKESISHQDNRLVGVRFKPAAFLSFYNFASLNEVTDQVIEFEQSLAPDLRKVQQSPISYLNSFFLNRQIRPKHNLSDIIKAIEMANGQVTIDYLAKQNHTTQRQLERNFQRYIGISPKEFANIVRFRSALSKIKHRRQEESLLSIAFDCGYYDHAHLANEIKRYTGSTPSLI